MATGATFFEFFLRLSAAANRLVCTKLGLTEKLLCPKVLPQSKLVVLGLAKV